MKSRRLLAALLIGATVALASALTADGGVVPISRVSSIELTAYVVTETFDDTSSADQFGSYDDGLFFEAGDREGTHAYGSIAQETTVQSAPDGRLTGSGNLYAQAFAQFEPGDTAGPLQIHGSSEMTIIFRIVDAAEPLFAEGDFSGLGFRGASASMSLAEISDPDAPRSIFGDDNSQYPTFDRSTTLNPGLYRLFAAAGAGSSGSSPGDPYSFGQDSTLDFSFSIGQPGEVLIPLPAALWPGLALLAGCACLHARRRA